MHRIIRKNYEELIREKKNEIERLNKEKEQEIQNVKIQMGEKRKIEQDKMLQSIQMEKQKHRKKDKIIQSTHENSKIQDINSGQMINDYFLWFFGITCLISIFYFYGIFI